MLSTETVDSHVHHIFLKPDLPETRGLGRRVLAVLKLLRG
jgi:hypothetical protein